MGKHLVYPEQVRDNAIRRQLKRAECYKCVHDVNQILLDDRYSRVVNKACSLRCDCYPSTAYMCPAYKEVES